MSDNNESSLNDEEKDINTIDNEEKDNNKSKAANEDILNSILKTDHRKVMEDIFESDNSVKSLDLHKSNLFQKIIISLFIVLVIAIGVFFIVFNGFNKTINDGTTLSSNYNNKIILNIDSTMGVNDSGQIEYVLSFKNTEQYKMNNIELSARFPSEFSYYSSDTNPSSVNEEYIKWNFDSVNPGEEKKVVLNGTLFGAVGVDSVLSASLSYNFDSISSSFTSNNSFNVAITKPIFDIVLDRNDIFYKGKDIVYKIKIKNNSDKALRNLKVALMYPESFKISKYSDEPSKVYGNDQTYWVVDIAKKQEDKVDNNSDDYYEKIITVTGKIDLDNINEVNLNISAGLVSDMSDIEDVKYTFVKEDIIRTATSGLNFSVNTASAIVDSGVSRIASANVNDVYKISFKYGKSIANLSFKDLRLVVEFLGDDIIDPKMTFNIAPKVSSTISGSSSNIIVEWNKDNNATFKDLSTKDNEVNMSFKFKKDLLKKYKEGGYFSNVKVTLFGKNSSSEETILVDNKTFKLMLDSNLSVAYSSSKVTLKSGVTTVSPVVLTVNLDNNYNKLTGAAVYFTLPAGVEFTSDSALSKSTKFDYDESSRKISWVIGDIDAFEKGISGKFYVNVTPDASVVGKTMSLTSRINVIYRDTNLNKDMSLDLNPIVSVNKVSK